MGNAMQPMREPTYFTLAALLDGPLHGYAIAKRAEEVSDGRVRLTAGTLYAALERLLERGLVAVEGEEVVSGRARRYYRLTPAGGTALEAEAARLHSAASVVVSRMAIAALEPV
jgi:PadR family transcriptional regulator, regulatory protein PadR